MDFAAEFHAISTHLSARGYRVAIIGGVALAAYGHPRMTLDLDVVADAAGAEVAVHLMESGGFETLHRSPAFSNHRHADRRRGRVDFMYVRNSTAERIFTSLRVLPGPAGTKIPVPRPEYLAAMKVQAMADAPDRMWQDLSDVGYLLRIDGVDRDEIHGYFTRAGLEDKWHELERHL